MKTLHASDMSVNNIQTHVLTQFAT